MLAEGLVWGTYRQYMDPYFQTGVYVFHIALASIYHYLRAYQFALRKKDTPHRLPLTVIKIVAINFAVILACWAGLKMGGLAQSLGLSIIPALVWTIDIQSFSVWGGTASNCQRYFPCLSSPLALRRPRGH